MAIDLTQVAAMDTVALEMHGLRAARPVEFHAHRHRWLRRAGAERGEELVAER